MTIGPDSRPRLAPYARLQWDGQRAHWVVLAPERLFYPDETGLAVLRRCDGTRSLSAIAADLAEEYAAQPEEVQRDLIGFLQALADKGVIVDDPA